MLSEAIRRRGKASNFNKTTVVGQKNHVKTREKCAENVRVTLKIRGYSRCKGKTAISPVQREYGLMQNETLVTRSRFHSESNWHNCPCFPHAFRAIGRDFLDPQTDRVLQQECQGHPSRFLRLSSKAI